MRSVLSENLKAIRERLAAAAQRSGRTADDVTLVAVTKYVDLETTRAMVDAGHRVLGESRPQILWDKASGIERESIQWHMIGHLQRNKVERTVPFCHLIHSVDSLRLMKAIDAAAAKADLVARCLLEVNISGEPTKYGFQPAELESVLVEAAGLPHVRVRGLMGMASLAGDLEANRFEFARLRETRDSMSSFVTDNISLDELSMGMSRDFEVAIEEGATIVRVGSVLFEGVR